jgi:hypothetical protein
MLLSNSIYKTILISVALLCAIMVIACSRSRESAQRVATERLRNDFLEGDISEDLFQGPILLRSDEKDYVFQWASTVPEPGATIIEISVSKSRLGTVGLFIKGKRSDPMYLGSSRRMPFNMSVLSMLFDLPCTPDDKSIFVKPLREIPLTPNQLSDVASFVHIKRDLMEYNPCYKKGYPDSLEEFNHISNPDSCAMFPLDSMFTHDHWGHKYFYNNLGNMVILGTPGKNEKWDFNKAAMDSLYNYPWQQIYTTDDDIVVRFWPAPLR